MCQRVPHAFCSDSTSADPTQPLPSEIRFYAFPCNMSRGGARRLAFLRSLCTASRRGWCIASRRCTQSILYRGSRVSAAFHGSRVGSALDFRHHGHVHAPVQQESRRHGTSNRLDSKGHRHRHRLPLCHRIPRPLGRSATGTLPSQPWRNLLLSVLGLDVFSFLARIPLRLPSGFANRCPESI